MSIQERTNQDGSKSYRALVRLKGHPQLSETFQRKTDAKRWLEKTKSEILEGRYFNKPEASKRTLEELINYYIEYRLPQRGKDKETVGPQLLWWKSQLGKFFLKDVTPPVIVECRDRLLRTPMHKKGEKKPRILSNATVVRYLASLSVCFAYGMEDLGWIESNPVHKVRKPTPERGRVRYLTEEEQNDLLYACQKSKNPFILIIVVIALSTGARMSEILTLAWRQIDFKRKAILLEKTKNGERRTLPLTGLAFEKLLQLSKVRRLDTNLVFPRTDGRKPLEIKRQWAKIVQEANLKDFRFHDLRHTAASYLAMNGASLVEIATILGHKKMDMVKRYAHLSEQHTHSVVEKMNAKLFENMPLLDRVAASDLK